MGNVKLIRTYFLESGVVDGQYGSDAETRETEWENVTASLAARVIRNEGLSFAASGADWASNPDGSYVANYTTGLRVETTAHLSGFPERVVNAIQNAVDPQREAACRALLKSLRALNK